MKSAFLASLSALGASGLFWLIVAGSQTSEHEATQPVELYPAADAALAARDATLSAHAQSVEPRRPLPVATRSNHEPAQAPLELSASQTICLPADVPPMAVAAAIDLLLELERPTQALALLRRHPRTGVEPYLDTALALSRLEWNAEATELFEQAFLRDPYDDELVESFMQHDPRACLAAIEAYELQQQRYEPDFDDFDLWRARALHDLGSTQECAQLLPRIESYYREGSGCTPTHLGGEPWELEALRKLDPVGLRDVVVRVLEDSSTSQERALVELAALCNELADTQLFEAHLAEFEQRHQLGTQLLIDLAPYRGWQSLESYWRDEPANDRLAGALAEHYLEQGRRAEAVSIWSTSLQESWSAGSDSDSVLELLSQAPRELRPLLEQRIQDLNSGHGELEDPAWELGQYGAWFWRQGEERRAKQIWAQAAELDPEYVQCWREEQQMFELGVLE